MAGLIISGGFHFPVISSYKKEELFQRQLMGKGPEDGRAEDAGEILGEMSCVNITPHLAAAVSAGSSRKNSAAAASAALSSAPAGEAGEGAAALMRSREETGGGRHGASSGPPWRSSWRV